MHVFSFKKDFSDIVILMIFNRQLIICVIKYILVTVLNYSIVNLIFQYIVKY